MISGVFLSPWLPAAQPTAAHSKVSESSWRMIDDLALLGQWMVARNVGAILAAVQAGVKIGSLPQQTDDPA